MGYAKDCVVLSPWPEYRRNDSLHFSTSNVVQGEIVDQQTIDEPYIYIYIYIEREREREREKETCSAIA